MRVKIYSNEHTAWWKENYFGYTNNESEAGIFEIEEVNKKYPYIDFDTTKEDYLVKFEGLTYEELEKENQELKDTNMKYAKIIDDFQTKNMRLEKAFDIIKNKRVDVDYFLTIIEKYNELEKQMKVYNHLNCVYEMLTQEEYELLKEVLADE